MEASLLGTKIGMTQIIGDHGVVEPVTVVKAGPCVVIQVKTQQIDGYDAVQLGFADTKPHRSTKPLIGHAAVAGTGPKRYLREIRLSGPASVSQGDVVTVASFEDGVTYVDVVGITKGKGFAGGMKRHGFGGKEATHGVERKHRSIGSIGGNAPGATGRGIKKGKKMPGHMGAVRRTAHGLKLLKVDSQADLLLIRGSVPGANGSMVLVRKAVKRH